MLIRKLGSGELYPMSLFFLADPSIEIVQDYLQRGECYVGEVKDQIVSAYVLLPTRARTVELVNIAVEPRYQGRGLGKRMVAHAIDTARKQGYKMMEIGTGNSSIGQLALYQKCGFRITGVDLDFFSHMYDEPIIENGIECRDMIRLVQRLE
ncbi:GNAT family N-acetyltransferase [Sulfobacillus thermotolerans]|uniref:GNAT family N-acetyltransferase n=1 Tax=Sulfobacillus thermotolerans TaxID=338644 RepID=A0ABM6RTB3_9FIRM|nr:GNAT family N-acetyltransferase [Sulfobacillus thermotolerans]